MNTLLIIVVVALPLVFVGWGIGVYNRMVGLRNQVQAAWSDIDVQLQRRFDLVPNLIEVAKGYCQHERETLKEVAARWSSGDQQPDSRAHQENRLSSALGRLIAVAEDYPDLKASDQFQSLHRGLVEVEDHLQYARRYYNGSVRDFNVRLESFPDLFIARWFAFKPAAFFEIERASHRQTPEVVLS